MSLVSNQYRTCETYGIPDDPEIRDLLLPNDNTPIKILKLSIHTFSIDGVSPPLVSELMVDNQMETMNELYLPYKIQFEWDFYIHQDSSIYNNGIDILYENFIDTCEDWNDYGIPAPLVNESYAITPETSLNVYVAELPFYNEIQCGVFDMYIGFSTFPWDPLFLTQYGDIFIHYDFFGSNQTVFSHELGHALGLWHTFHGVEEVEECGDCYEYSSGFEADFRGDLCSDTPAAPFYRECENPGGNDCLNEPWGETLYDNIMSYSYCQNTFTEQQVARMHAWIGYRLSELCVNSDCEVFGCNDELACNYNPTLIHDVALCLYNEECNQSIYFGDINNDGLIDILDIVILVNLIVGTASPTEFELLTLDYNDDGILDIIDIVGFINIIVANITIEKIEEENGFSYQCYPNAEGEFPVVLYNHGGLGQSIGGDLFNTCRILAENGYLARSEKRQETISLEGHLEEVIFALDNLKNHEKADSTKVGVIGFSRGGLLSLQVSILDTDIDALILLAPATGNGLIYDLFDSFSLINSTTQIQISENDSSPDNLVEVSYDIYNTMLQNNVNVQMIEYPPYDSNNNGVIDENDDGHQLFFTVQEAYWNDLVEFLNEILN